MMADNDFILCHSCVELELLYNLAYDKDLLSVAHEWRWEKSEIRVKITRMLALMITKVEAKYCITSMVEQTVILLMTLHQLSLVNRGETFDLKYIRCRKIKIKDRDELDVIPIKNNCRFWDFYGNASKRLPSNHLVCHILRIFPHLKRWFFLVFSHIFNGYEVNIY